MMRAVLLLTLALPVAAEPFSPTSSYLTMLVSLAGIVALILLLAWLSKRLQLPLPGQGAMKVIATLPLSTKERLMVVQVGEQQYLISSGANGTRLLHQLDQPLAEKEPVQFGSILDRFNNTQER